MEYEHNEEKFVDPDLFRGNKIYSTQLQEGQVAKVPERTVKEEGDKQTYKWMKVIGQGTFGVVYKVKDRNTDVIYAIKKVFQDPNYQNREFTIVIELDHVNCINVHNYFFTIDDDGKKKDASYLNLVMDYVPDTLYRVLRYYKKKDMNFPDALGKIYSYQMFRALAYIQAHGIVHRDIKPQNILVDTKSHRLVICDFGSAKKIKPGEKSVAYICSRYYRAPELILGRSKYGPFIDMWSIACVIAEMFLGEPLFPGTSSKDQMVKIINLLGTPTADEIEAMNPGVKVRLPEQQAKGLSTYKKKITNPQVVDLLDRVLVYDPDKRLTPLEALQHPYFDELRKQKLTINGKEIVDLFNFTEFELMGDVDLLNTLIPKWYKKKRTGN